MDLKTVGITGALIASIGLGGVLGTTLPVGDPEIRTHAEIKAEACDGKFIQYEDDLGNYYCATGEQMTSDWEKEQKKFKDNKTKKEDYVYLTLVAKNDPEKRKVLENDIIAKYNKKTKQFDGKKMGEDFNYQLHFYSTLAEIECGDKCALTGDTMDEKIYNLLTKK